MKTLNSVSKSKLRTHSNWPRKTTTKPKFKEFIVNLWINNESNPQSNKTTLDLKPQTPMIKFNKKKSVFAYERNEFLDLFIKIVEESK